MNNLTGQTPEQIDTKLAPLAAARWAAAERLHRLHDYLERARFDRQRDEYRTQIAENQAKLDEMTAQMAPLEAQYTARRWARFFLVPDGHVHRPRS